MVSKFNYTNKARAFALKYPSLNHILIQINFWIAAFIVLAVILNFNSELIIKTFEIETTLSLHAAILMAVLGGIFFGGMLGIVDRLMEKSLRKCISMGINILLHFIAYYIILVITLLFLKYILWNNLILPNFYNGISPFDEEIMWKSFYKITLVYSFMMTLVISFINQMNKKFGPGILLPLLLGKYQSPKEEQRIFMFMDLRGSTTLAEKLGHIKYSSFIRDSFTDINYVLAKHQAEIYQYVGDEIVVSWPMNMNEDKISCVEFFFSCQDQFNERKNYYLENYGELPKFKAGLHQGFVTAVEVGEIKRDIAYHGDTINTASRIQQKCNEYNTDFLISNIFGEELNWKEKFSKKFVGTVNLRGKEKPVDIYSVSLV